MRGKDDGWVRVRLTVAQSGGANPTVPRCGMGLPQYRPNRTIGPHKPWACEQQRLERTFDAGRR